MTAERDDIGRVLGAARRADGRGQGPQRRRTEIDSRRSLRRWVAPVGIGVALFLALLGGVITKQAGGLDLARVPTGDAAVSAPIYASNSWTEYEPFVAEDSRARNAVSGDYRLSPPNEAEPAGASSVEDPAAPAQSRVPAPGPAWSDARDYGPSATSPAVRGSRQRYLLTIDERDYGPVATRWDSFDTPCPSIQRHCNR